MEIIQDIKVNKPFETMLQLIWKIIQKISKSSIVVLEERHTVACTHVHSTVVKNKLRTLTDG